MEKSSECRPKGNRKLLFANEISKYFDSDNFQEVSTLLWKASPKIRIALSNPTKAVIIQAHLLPPNLKRLSSLKITFRKLIKLKAQTKLLSMK